MKYLKKFNESTQENVRELRRLLKSTIDWEFYNYVIELVSPFQEYDACFIYIMVLVDSCVYRYSFQDGKLKYEWVDLSNDYVDKLIKKIKLDDKLNIAYDINVMYSNSDAEMTSLFESQFEVIKKEILEKYPDFKVIQDKKHSLTLRK